MWKLSAVAAAIAVAASLAVAGGASARPSSSLTLVVLGTSQSSATTQPRFGGQVTFDLQTAAAEPWVSVTCSQAGVPVYGQYWGFWSGYDPSVVTSTMAADGVFTLGPTALWSSGPARCVATLFTVARNHKQTVLATLGFDAAG